MDQLFIFRYQKITFAHIDKNFIFGYCIGKYVLLNLLFMKKTYIQKTRPLTEDERRISRKLYPAARKKFYMRLMNGDDFETEVLPWAIKKITNRGKEADICEEVLEALTVCSKQKLPELYMLEKALQVSLEADKTVYERQLNLIIPLFYEYKPEEYEKKFKKISYHFLDALAEKVGLFNGNMLSYIFAGEYFSTASAVLLAKHADVLLPISSVCRTKLHNMFMTLAQKEDIVAESDEDIAIRLFETSLRRQLHKEEVSLMIIYVLMQIYSWSFVDTHKKPYVSNGSTKAIEQAISFCETNGYGDLEMWEKALTLTSSRILWNKQVALISRWLLRIRLDDFCQLKAVTYRFILKSFQYGFVSSEIIDFIFDGRSFSNASTVVLALSSSTLKENNLAVYIQEHLSSMMKQLITQEWIECKPDNIADYLLDNSLARGISKEEISILNLYVLSHAF